MTVYRGQVKGFTIIVQQGMYLLGDTMKIQDLLLLKWCWMHHKEHSEISCIPCQNEITKLISLVPYKEDDHTINVEEVQSPSCEGLEPQTMDPISKTTLPKEYNQEILRLSNNRRKIFLLFLTLLKCSCNQKLNNLNCSKTLSLRNNNHLRKLIWSLTLRWKI